MSAPPLLTTTLQSLLNEEHQRTYDAQERLGTIVPIAQQGLSILSTSVVSVTANNGIIAAIMLAIQKSATLAFLSYVRAHTAQAEFNSRQAIEFTALGAYLLANPNSDVLDITDPENPRLLPNKTLALRAHKWLEQAEPELNGLLKTFKHQINESTAHGSIYVTHLTVNLDSLTEDGDAFTGSFFDNLEINDARAYLMSFCRLIVLVVETIRRANENTQGIGMKEGLEDEIARYAYVVDGYREALGEVIRHEKEQGA